MHYVKVLEQWEARDLLMKLANVASYSCIRGKEISVVLSFENQSDATAAADKLRVRGFEIETGE